MREYFKDLPDETTPVDAERLNGLFNGEESIEKLVVGDIECKNIFDEQWGELNKRYANVTTSKFPIQSQEGGTYCANPIKLDRTKSYLIMSTNSSYTTNGIYFYDENGIFLTRVYLNFGKVITIPTDAYYMTFNLTDVTDISDLANYTWQVEYIDSETGTSTPYSKMKKYGYNSIDSMGSIVVDDISCKNLFNKYGKLNEKFGYTTGDTTLLSDGTIKATSNYAAGNGPGPIIILKPNTDYIVSFDVISMETTGSCTFRAYGINEDGNIELIFDKYFSSTGHHYQAFNSGKHSKVWLTFNGIFNSDDTSARKYTIYDNVQIEEGTVFSEYTPYKNFDNTEYILYDDATGATDNIPLTNSSANYKYLEIYFFKTKELGTFYTKVFNPNGKEVGLIASIPQTDGALQMLSSRFYIGDNQITFVAGGYLNFWLDGSSKQFDFGQSNEIRITRVIGYK